MKNVDNAKVFLDFFAIMANNGARKMVIFKNRR